MIEIIRCYVLGFGLFVAPSCIHASQVATLFTFWILSPVIGAAFGYVFAVIIQKVIFDQPDPLSRYVRRGGAHDVMT